MTEVKVEGLPDDKATWEEPLSERVRSVIRNRIEEGWRFMSSFNTTPFCNAGGSRNGVFNLYQRGYGRRAKD